ncbi:alpha/beta hydrolase [Nocardioides sp. CGMCC 1.13656]|uniref:alpha/beta hydrolase n=1 Tax=Nocardioides TaxID=1839 RepID=UPI0015EBC416|nr:alpha/beta hydrolase [Nocardioides sp. CGMCC 1.13656]MBA2954581.1 alpha/beta hydrolase [Nocardioides sp. CGMCC 1.13656]
MNALEPVETLLLRAALALPPRVQRVLAGRPVVVDGEPLAVDTQLMLRIQRLIREPAAESLPIPEGRRAIRRHTRLVAGRQPIGEVRDLRVAGLPARLYTPSLSRGPLLVFFHGGGFMYGDLESHDAACRFLAERSGVRVLAVDYRLGPEQPFPAAYDDALAAYRWVVEHADEVGADPTRLAVGGDSAGGNLAAVVAIEAAREGLPLALQLLVYPVTDAARETASSTSFQTGFYLTSAFMDLAHDSYVAGGDPRDPRISPAYADLPATLAPAYVVTAGFDPLRDEGEEYAALLEKAGAAVELRRFGDQIHGFFNMVGVGRSARAANAEIAAALRRHLA